MNKPVKANHLEAGLRVDIQAPCRGFVVALDAIPDAAFAGGALGPGIGIEPLESGLYAPCDAEVIAVSRTRHAVTLKAGNGAEILIHAGIDTVKLDGKGFAPQVSAGQSVKAGDPLLQLDLGALAEAAPSLCTPVIITNGDAFAVDVLAAPGLVDRGAQILQATATTAVAELADSSGESARETLILELADGVHARPAARIAKCAKGFSGRIELVRDGVTVNAKSAASLMGLGTAHGDRIEIIATGSGAAEAVAELAALIRAGAGDAVTPVAADSPVLVEAPAGTPAELSGVAASPGVAVGPIHLHTAAQFDIPATAEDIAAEQARLDAALKQVQTAIADEARQARGERAALLEAHAELADDPALIDAARDLIAQGASAGAAWQAVTREQAAQLEATGDKRMAERVADLADIEARILGALYGTAEAVDPADLSGAIIIAADLLPSEFMRYAQAGIAGLALAEGGATSHVAILAAAENVPALIGLGPRALSLPQGNPALLDTAACKLVLDPPDAAVTAIRDRKRQRKEAEALAALAAGDPARTRDDRRIHVYANLASIDDATSALRNGAEGCGLLRTEFLFTHRRTPPGETEQAEVYMAISQCLKNQPLTVRTLDIGGDKPVPFLDLGDEPNPALGLRGIRTLFAHPELMREQVRALLGVAARRDIQIMLPMVSSPSELVDFRRIARELADEMEIDKLPPIGTMIETPASAVIADQICAVADFVSIGTNDLTQYTLAMDRGHAALAGRMDALHPAVLALIGQVGAAARRAGIPASVCGGLASDPVAVPALIGLGIGKLSVVQSMIAPIKAIVRELDAEHCTRFAADLHTLDSAEMIRARLVAEWPQLDRWR